MARCKDDYPPGTRVLAFVIDCERPYESVLLAANYVGRRGTWRRYRNLKTGEEWSEPDLRWFPSADEALFDYFERQSLATAHHIRNRDASSSRRAYEQFIYATSLAAKYRSHRKKGG